MPDLPDVSQEFTADTGPYVAQMQLAIDAAERFRNMNLEAIASIEMLEAKMTGEAAAAAETAAAQDAAADAVRNGAEANTAGAAAANANADAANRLTGAEGEAAAGARTAASGINDLRDSALEAATAMSTLKYNIAQAGLTADAAAVAAVPAMDDWMLKMAEAAGVAKEAEAYIDGMAGAIDESGGDAVKAAAGIKVYSASVADAEISVSKLAIEEEIAAQNIQNTGNEALIAAAKMSASAGIQSTAASQATGFWARWGTVIHWVIAGGAEFLAVFIPAMVAAAAAATVMSDAIGFVAYRLKAMYDVQQAVGAIYGTTIDNMLGFTSIMQQAQNAADPGVYELLGAAINILRADSGNFVSMGVKVVGVLDEFAAKITGELTGALGGQLTGLVSKGATDLAELGAVIGNLGHTVLNLASDMPGLAEVLLAVFVGASKLLEILSSMPAKIITVAMGFEEFARWGSLVSSMLGRMTGVATESMGGWYRLFSNAEIVSQNFARIAVSSLANVYSGLGNLTMRAGSWASSWGASMRDAGDAEVTMGEDGVLAAGKTTVLQDAMYSTGAAADAMGGEMMAAGAEMTTTAAEFEALAAAITPLEALLAVAAVVGFGMLGYEATKSSTALDTWAASINKSLGEASDLQLIPKTVADIADATGKLSQAQEQWNNVAKADPAGEVASRYQGMSSAMESATANVSAARTEQDYLYQALNNTRNGAALLALTYGTTFTGALAIAQAAGVNLSKGILGTGAAAVDARLQVANYMAGMEAMGQQAGVVGHDVTMMGIASELSATKVSQLNQAIDGFVSGVTGGTADLGALTQSILNVGQATATTTGTLSDAKNGMNLSLSQIQHGLTNFGDTGSQVWENFDNALSGSAEQLADWFRTAGAEGAISGPQFTKAMQDIVSEFIPFAKDSKTAQEELVGFAQAQGLNVTSFGQLEKQLKDAGASTSNLAKITGLTTAGMADMNQVAQALGASIGTDVVGAMNQATLAASGLTGAATDLAGAWNRAHNVNSQVVSGFAQTVKSLFEVYHNTGQAKAAADAYAKSLGMTQGQVNTLNGDIQGLIHQLNSIHSPPPIDITTNYVTNGSPSTAAGAGGIFPTPTGHPVYQTGTNYTPGGFALVGDAGPELVRLPTGSSVLPSWQTAGVMNSGGSGGGGEGIIGLALRIPVNIGGQRVASANIRQSLTYQRRNPSNNLSLRTR
jgi:hypothetical protein